MVERRGRWLGTIFVAVCGDRGGVSRGSRATTSFCPQHELSPAASQLIHAFITSRIDYCNSILYGMPDTILFDLQRIQNTAARILTKCGDRNYPSINLLKKLHWLPCS